MKSPVQLMSGLDPRARRAAIMIMDIVMVLLAIPLSLLLSQSRLSFDPYSWLGLAILFGVGLLSHVVFRLSGLYNTVWRFASTPDFFNIIRDCGILALCLWAIANGVRMITPVTGLNERQFIVFFLVAFTIISAPRLIYRYLREGAAWGAALRAQSENEKRALFVGKLTEADIIIRYARASGQTRIIGIMAIEPEAHQGTSLQGTPVVATRANLASSLEAYADGTKSIDLLIFGPGAEKELEEFSELVRVARRSGIEVVQFSGLSQLKRGGQLVLEAVEMETILRRATVPTDIDRLRGFLSGKRVLVTGGAGSIGRTLVRRSLELDAAGVLVADASEFGVFQLNESLAEDSRARLTSRILDVADKQLFRRLVRDFAPDIIFHAAALKHVPLVEENWVSAIKTNVFATQSCAEVAAECGVGQFVLISSDKAADPSSILGLTKRVAEQIVSALHFSENGPAGQRTNFTAVRFGNVFGSDGSVATVFQKQIRAGGPVTITDREMTRYLMTTGEAVDLVIMSAADSASKARNHEHGIYMLDMGEPVSILEVAETMIRLAGKKPYTDIPISFTGIRPGEKLHEALNAEGEKLVTLDVPSLFGVKSGVFTWQEIQHALKALQKAIGEDDKAAAIAVMDALYRPAPAEDPRWTEPLPVAVQAVA